MLFQMDILVHLGLLCTAFEQFKGGKSIDLGQLST